MQIVGAYEAKTYLPRLLEAVANGEVVTITKHGVPVAMLVPPSHAPRVSTNEAIAALRQFRRGKTLNGTSIQALIDEGRRF